MGDVVGAARSRALVAVALVALAAPALLSACRGGDAPGDVDAAALLRSAAERTELVQSFHFLLEHEHGATQIVRGLLMTRAEGDAVGSDRLKLDVKATAGPLNLNVGIVVIGPEAWITNPLTGRWERERISLQQVFDPAHGVTALMRAASAPSITATERVGGARTYRVEANVDSGQVTLFGTPQAGRRLRAIAWVGVDDPLVYRIVLQGPITAGEAPDIERHLMLSNFDARIDISPPQ